jgi:UDPglucose 6-dehydrogenase
MKIAIIGAGYVGLVTAACLSEFGFDVTCVEREKRKIDQLLAGEVPFYEPGLAKIVTNNVGAGRLKFTGRSVKPCRTPLWCSLPLVRPRAATAFLPI